MGFVKYVQASLDYLLDFETDDIIDDVKDGQQDFKS